MGRTFSEVDALEVTQILRAAARSEIMPRFRRLHVDAVREKTGPSDLVTVADEEAERLITQGLERRVPRLRSDRRGGGLRRSSDVSPGSGMPTWRSSSIRSTAPPTSLPACRCSA